VTQKEPHEHDPALKHWSYDVLPFSFPIKNALKIINEGKQQFNVIKTLINDPRTDMIINAGDSGREGYLIQKWIYRMAGNTKPEKVLWIDSFTKEAVLTGFANLHDDSEFDDLLQEAEARAEADWIMGMNYSRALSLRQEFGSELLSYGRCQTPLLNLIGIRDAQIANFKPEPYFNVKAKFKAESGQYAGMLIGQDKKNINLADKYEAEAIANATAATKTATVISHKTAQQKKAAPLLFDLGTLQTEAGNRYGYTADETLKIAQSLYETHKILSYPRTDSKYLSTALLKEIHKNLEKCAFGDYAPFVNKIKLNHWQVGKEYCNDKKITDHPALIPTITDIESEYAKLNKAERNVFDLVVRRFLAIFYPPYIYQATEIITQAGNYLYKSNGRVPMSMGYKEVFADAKENDEKKKKEEDDPNIELPPMQQGDTVTTLGAEVIDKMTEPPAKVTVGNIIKLMEKYNIGTPATRAKIVELLIKRGYISQDKKKYNITPLGQSLLASVPDDLKDPQLTNRVETQLEEIGDGKMTKEEFLGLLMEDIRRHIKDLEKTTIRGTAAARAAAASLGECPLCGGMVVKIKPKKKEDGTQPKAFYGCMGYKEGCKFRIWGEMCGKTFTDAEVKKILPKLKKGGRTNPISGFKKKDGTPFKADPVLFWDAENERLSFEFVQNEKKDGKK
jgi:DNA topoisomerase-3